MWFFTWRHGINCSGRLVPSCQTSICIAMLLLGHVEITDFPLSSIQQYLTFFMNDKGLNFTIVLFLPRTALRKRNCVWKTACKDLCTLKKITREGHASVRRCLGKLGEETDVHWLTCYVSEREVDQAEVPATFSLTIFFFLINYVQCLKTDCSL